MCSILNRELSRALIMIICYAKCRSRFIVLVNFCLFEQSEIMTIAEQQHSSDPVPDIKLYQRNRQNKTLADL